MSIIRSRNFAVLTAAFLVGFVGIQFIRPEIMNSPGTAKPKLPAAVEHILRDACYNCHSSETTLAWFDQIAPAYWLVANHVNEGRKHFNFSEMGSMPLPQQNAALFEAFNQIQLGAMPPQSYSLIHPESKLTSEKLKVLKTYLESLEFHEVSDAQASRSADAQYANWIAAMAPSAKVQPAPNGIKFPSDYKNWTAISSTDRLDNNTMREVLGNEVAVKAIEAGQINPWPDGTIFAKVAWEKLVDAEGMVHAGQFKQVEFMMKDGRKYADTEGWGWARWLGMELQPFGTNRAFTASCISCHLPMHKNDFVFTAPLKPIMGECSLPAGLHGDVLKWRVITSGVDNRDSTMSTLFGNEIAVNHVRTDPHGSYPPGSVVALGTWFQREDPNWLGAMVPGRLKSMEIVRADSNSNLPTSFSYENYAGASLQRLPLAAGGAASGRVARLLQQRAAVTP